MAVEQYWENSLWEKIRMQWFSFTFLENTVPEMPIYIFGDQQLGPMQIVVA